MHLFTGHLHLQILHLNISQTQLAFLTLTPENSPPLGIHNPGNGTKKATQLKNQAKQLTEFPKYPEAFSNIFGEWKEAEITGDTPLTLMLSVAWACQESSCVESHGHPLAVLNIFLTLTS